jgi:hypothetical protein
MEKNPTAHRKCYAKRKLLYFSAEGFAMERLIPPDLCTNVEISEILYKYGFLQYLLFP